MINVGLARNYSIHELSYRSPKQSQWYLVVRKAQDHKWPSWEGVGSIPQIARVRALAWVHMASVFDVCILGLLRLANDLLDRLTAIAMISGGTKRSMPCQVGKLVGRRLCSSDCPKSSPGMSRYWIGIWCKSNGLSGHMDHFECPSPGTINMISGGNSYRPKMKSPPAWDTSAGRGNLCRVILYTYVSVRHICEDCCRVSDHQISPLLLHPQVHAKILPVVDCRCFRALPAFATPACDMSGVHTNGSFRIKKYAVNFVSTTRLRLCW